MKQRWLIVGPLLVISGVVLGVTLLRPSTSSVGSEPEASGPALDPQAISPTIGSIRSVLVLDGVIVADQPVVVRTEAAGIVSSFGPRLETAVESGQTLLSVRGQAGETAIAASSSGILISIDVLAGQEVAVGDTVATIAPESYRAVAPIDPVLLYRLYDEPLSIRATIDRGPAPFDCAFISLHAPVGEGSNPLDAPVQLECGVPDSVRAFSGVRVQLAVTTADARDALLLPVEAVEGSADRGFVTVVGPTGTERREVTLGISDGLRIQILRGLREDEQVLEFPPVPNP